MDGIVFNIIYAGVFICVIVILGYIFSNDAKKFLNRGNGLTKTHNALINALSYLNNHMADDGGLSFKKQSKTKGFITKYYDVTSHAGLLYTLYLCEQEFQIDGLKKRRLISSKYFIDNYLKKISEDKIAIISHPNEENLTSTQAKTSSVAMALIAFSNLYQNNFLSEEIYFGLGQFLLFMQLKSGQFYNSYNVEKESINQNSNNLSYTCEAPLGLLYLYQNDKKQKWLESAKKGILFIANLYINKSTAPFDKYFIMSSEILFKLSENVIDENENKVITQHIIKMLIPMLKRQILEPSDKYYGGFADDLTILNVANYIEGAIAAYGTLQNIKLTTKLMKSINAGIVFLRRSQIAMGKEKGGFPNSADYREAGVPKTASVINLKTAQQATTTYIKFQNLFKN